MTRTYSRSTFEEARAAWAEGEFGAAWEPYRKAAAEAGYIFPPNGTEFDDWTVEDPSQRAVLYEAIENTPKALMDAVQASHSWSQVVARMTQHRARLRETADLAGRDAAWERRDDPTKEQATEALRGILGRLPDAPPGPTPDARAIGAER